MRQLTLEQGYFTVTDIADRIAVPRSTVQDWINRLLEEGCVVMREEKRGRHAAHYLASSAMPSSACRRIFTTIDGDCVEIYHECMSGGCAAFCAFHHTRAGGALDRIYRDGTLLRERARLGSRDVSIGLDPAPAVGIVGIRREGDYIVQHIKCTGGPAYSLTDMMAFADGVCDVTVHRSGAIVEGDVVTRALTYVIIGIDDTDSREGGATFALALALLQHMSSMEGVLPIGHRVAMLNPHLRERTAGNSCSYIELAVEPVIVGRIAEAASRFVAGEALSPEWGIAVKEGFVIQKALREYGKAVRESVVDLQVAETTADTHGVTLIGGRGVIGALGAVSLAGLPHAVLLDPRKDVGAGGERDV